MQDNIYLIKETRSLLNSKVKHAKLGRQSLSYTSPLHLD